ncbi:MAG TPA: DUF6714 family protein [Candidatus Angelobacter sp.]|jgi:hypothetical protein|nr:DUF6714 family protein [Candidatus Angelobacter sp.]
MRKIANKRKEQVLSELEIQTIELIRNAFASTPYPGDENLILDRGPEDIECLSVKGNLAGRNWQEVAPSILAKSYPLSCLTPAAYHYFLPAYLCLILEHYDQADVLVGDIIFNLSNESTRFQDVVQLLSPIEKTAIKEFLHCVQSIHGNNFPDQMPLRVLEHHWKNF